MKCNLHCTVSRALALMLPSTFSALQVYWPSSSGLISWRIRAPLDSTTWRPTGSVEFTLNHVTLGGGFPAAVHFKMAVRLTLIVVSTGRCNKEGAEMDCPGAPFSPGGPLGPGGPGRPGNPRSLYTHWSLWSYWSIFTGRPCWAGSPSGARYTLGSSSSPPSSVTFWSWSTELFIFGTDFILQQAKLFFDQLFYFGGFHGNRFVLRGIWWISFFSVYNFATLKNVRSVLILEYRNTYKLAQFFEKLNNRIQGEFSRYIRWDGAREPLKYTSLVL